MKAVDRECYVDEWLPQIDLETCIRCGECVLQCPSGALGKVDGHPAVVNPHACTYCARCELVCPVDAVALPYIVCPLNPGEEGTS